MVLVRLVLDANHELRDLLIELAGTAFEWPDFHAGLLRLDFEPRIRAFHEFDELRLRQQVVAEEVEQAFLDDADALRST